MRLRTVLYFMRQAFVSLSRNGWMSILSVATVAIALFIIGSFFLLVANANAIASQLESDVRIVAFVDVSVPREEVLEIREKISKDIDGVVDVQLVPKEEGLKKLGERFGENNNLITALGGKNPLPDYFIIRAEQPQEVKNIARAVDGIDQVEKVDYGGKVIERLFEILRWVRLLGWAAMVMLTGAAVFLISVTIRLTVYARHKEINIMKYIGATDWFISWPFFLEGMILGLIGAAIALGTLYFSYVSLIQNLTLTLNFIPFISDPVFLGRTLCWLLLLGVVVGALGSLISVRRYLKV